MNKFIIFIIEGMIHSNHNIQAFLFRSLEDHRILLT